MKRITLSLLAAMFCIFLIGAQSMPIEFSDPADNFIGFSGSQFTALTDSDDPSNQLGQFFNDGSDPWQGFFLDLNTSVNFDENKIITLSFRQFDPNSHNIVVKFENGDNADVEVTVNTSGVGWKRDLEFDFESATLSGTNTTVNATGTYSRLTIFIDGGSATPGTYLIDDINDGSEQVDPNELDVIYDVLVWEDNFDGNTIDEEKWHHQTLVIIPGVGWANGEQQHYTDRPDNSFVQDGNLNIVAKREQYTSEGITMPFTSARLNSKFAFTYGRVDVRAKLPEGQGTWPAIWTLGKNINERGGYWQSQFGAVGWPTCGEIDIMEHGLHAVNETSSAIHTDAGSGGAAFTDFQAISDVSDNYHVYSVNWSPNQITFLVDDVGFLTYKPNPQTVNNWPFDLDQYILLNVAMGGIAGTVDNNFNESSMIIDYVRIYQNSQLSTETFELPKISLSPNPANEFINIKSDINIDRVSVYNMLGQEVINQLQIEDKLDVSQLSKGVYVINLYSGAEQNTLRFVKN